MAKRGETFIILSLKGPKKKNDRCLEVIFNGSFTVFIYINILTNTTFFFCYLKA